MEDNELDKKNFVIKTICRDCVFAKFNDDVSEQTGCTLNRLDKFKTQNRTNLISDMPDSVKYFEINTFCNTCRNADWSSKLENLEEKVLKEVQIRLDFIIFEEENLIGWEDRAITSLHSCIKQKILPKKIIFVFNKKTDKFKDFIDKVDKILVPLRIKYEVVNSMELLNSSNNLIDIAVTKSNSQYYSVIQSGFQVSNLIEKLNNFINFKLETVSLIYPFIDGNLTGLTVQRILHKTIGGNSNMPISTKIAELAKNQNLQHMIKSWKDLDE